MRRARALGVVGFVLGLCLVVQPAASPAAQAFVDPVTLPAVEIGTEAGVKVLPLRVLSLTSPIGLAVNAAALGYMGYETRDYWMPMVSDLLDGGGFDWMRWSTAAGGPTCYISESVQARTQGTNGVDDTILIDHGTNGCNWPNQINNTVGLNYQYWKSKTDQAVALCRNPATEAVYLQHFAEQSLGWNGSPDPATSPILPCGADREVLGFNYPKQWFGDEGGTGAYGEGLRWGVQVPAADLVLASEVTCRNAVTDAEQKIYPPPAPLGGTNVASCKAALGADWFNVALKTYALPSWMTSIADGAALGIDPIFQAERNDSTDPCYNATGCGVQIYLDNQPCTMGGLCANWFDLWKTEPARVECHYGGGVVPMRECFPLRRSYDPTTGVGTRVLDAPDDATTPDPNPKPGDSSIPDPNPDPGHTRTPNPDPDPNPQPTDSGIFADPKNGNNDGKCLPNGWHMLNPIEWVYEPTKCALKWAFVPTGTQLQTVTARMSTALSESTLGRWTGAIGGLLPDLSGPGGGCMGPGIPVPRVRTIYPFNACDEPIATVAQIARLIGSVSLSLGGAFACLRALGSGIGWSPGVGEKT